MKTHNFILGPVDTDSISFCKPDMSPFSEEEQKLLIDEINSHMPELIKYAHDGYYKTCIVLKAKNYILEDNNGKVKLRGSSLKDAKKEPALGEMIKRMIDCMLYDNPENMINIYHEYIIETHNVMDISRWAAKKTITKAILNCANDPTARLNERKVYEAVKDTAGLQEGNKAYLYPCIKSEQREETLLKNGKLKVKVIKDTGLKIIEQWSNDHDSEKLVERVVDTMDIFANVLDREQFIDYTLARNKNILTELLKSGINTKGNT